MKRAIIQAGGQGTRLRPYTAVLPKPLMPVADYPIMEIVIRQLAAHGFERITITLGHLGSLIMAIVGDGRAWGVQVDYVMEDHPRGTIGAVKLVKDIDGPFLVMNGDLLTDFDYGAFFEGHLSSHAQLSIGVYAKKVPVSLGVFDLDQDSQIVGFREKPQLCFPCSMGVYAFSPELLKFVPETGVFGFDDLMYTLLKHNVPMRAHHFSGLWLDIGRIEDYAEATELFLKCKAQLLPEAPAAKPRDHAHFAE